MSEVREGRPAQAPSQSSSGQKADQPASHLAKLLTTTLAWLVVYLLLLTIFTVFDEPLTAMTMPLRLLIVSGLLVMLMANMVMPSVTKMVERWSGQQSRVEPDATERGPSIPDRVETVVSHPTTEPPTRL